MVASIAYVINGKAISVNIRLEILDNLLGVGEACTSGWVYIWMPKKTNWVSGVVKPSSLEDLKETPSVFARSSIMRLSWRSSEKVGQAISMSST